VAKTSLFAKTDRSNFKRKLDAGLEFALKILVLGGSGMIGHRMWATLSQKHDVFATLRRENLGSLEQIPGISKQKCFFNVDAYSLKSVSEAIAKFRPEVVLNCIGIVKQLKDSNNALKSISMNALFPHQLAQICVDHSARMIQFSSDCVFDGSRGQYQEKDFQDAIDIYGRTKALGEISDLKNVLTIRTSSIGREVYPHGGLFEWFLNQQGKTAKGYCRAIYSGFPTHRLAHILSEFVIPHPELNGILHIASQPIDKYSLLMMIKEHFHLQVEIEQDTTVAIERSLDCSRFSSQTGFVPPSWKDMLKDLEVDFEIYKKIRG
jgi:dTDP-4-dehydrorhamnose reductase